MGIISLQPLCHGVIASQINHPKIHMLITNHISVKGTYTGTNGEAHLNGSRMRHNTVHGKDNKLAAAAHIFLRSDITVSHQLGIKSFGGCVTHLGKLTMFTGRVFIF